MPEGKSPGSNSRRRSERWSRPGSHPDWLASSRNQLREGIIVHTKGAESEALQLLKKYNIERVIVHRYSGPWHILKAVVAPGFHFTVGVEVVLSQHIQEIAAYLPAELILTETDNPGGTESLTGNIGTPSLVKAVIGKLAEIRGTSNQAIMTMVQNNLVRLGGNDPWLARVRGSTGWTTTLLDQSP